MTRGYHREVPPLSQTRAYIAAGRYAEARRELQRVLSEPAPTIIADWTVKDQPRATQLLESIKDQR